MTVDLFPLSQYWWLYASFTGFVLLVLALDLGFFHRNAHVVGFREAATWRVIWIFLALALHSPLCRYDALWKFPRNPQLARGKNRGGRS